jgi:predicted SnoaL-like aldol condensation-catalyzing enzyme
MKKTAIETNIIKNKELVTRFWNLVFNQHDLKTANTLMHNDYIQHNPNVATGLDGFNNHFTKVFAAFPELSSTTYRVIAEDNYVVLHSRTQRNPAALGKAHIDIFRVADGKIAEHWDVIQEIPMPGQSANNNTMF